MMRVTNVLFVLVTCRLAAAQTSAIQDLSRIGCKAALPNLQQQFARKGDAETQRLVGLALLQCRTAEKQFAEAAAVAERLESEYPKDADVLYAVADLHRKAWNDSIYKMYRRAPASFRVNQLSAEVFETQGRYAEAAAEYEKAIAKSPKTVNLHYRLGRAIILESHDGPALERAKKEFQAELALNPQDAAAEYQVAQILLLKSDKLGAASHFERALSLHADFPEAIIAVARLRSEKKQFAEAAQLLENAVKLQPTSETAHYNLMMAYRNGGRTADAQREKALLEKLQKPPEGEFTDFLKRLGEKAPPKQ